MKKSSTETDVDSMPEEQFGSPQTQGVELEMLGVISERKYELFQETWRCALGFRLISFTASIVFLYGITEGLMDMKWVFFFKKRCFSCYKMAE